MVLHPLQQYINLIENNYLGVVLSEFYDQNLFTSSFDPNLFDENEIFWNSNHKAYIQKNIKTKEVIYTFTFDNHLESILEHYDKNFKEKVRLYLLEHPEKGDEYAKYLKREIINLMRISSLKHKAFLPTILKRLELLDTFLNDLTGRNLINSNAAQQANIKLEWLGKISTLTTLFFDLSSDKNNLKTSLLKYDRALLAEFIFNNFTDEKGNDFNKSTIYRYLNANSLDEKKAKERLNIREDFETEFIDKKESIVKKATYNIVNEQASTPKTFKKIEKFLP